LHLNPAIWEAIAGTGRSNAFSAAICVRGRIAVVGWCVIGSV